MGVTFEQMDRWVLGHKRLCVLVVGVTAVVAGVVGWVYVHRLAPWSWGLYGPVYSTRGVAIQGYDPVAYRVFAEARMGDMSDSYQWRGVTWHFDSVVNMARFKANPQKYAPRFGGYCAEAAGRGWTTASDPLYWVVADGGLHLFADDAAIRAWKQRVGKGVVVFGGTEQ